MPSACATSYVPSGRASLITSRFSAPIRVCVLHARDEPLPPNTLRLLPDYGPDEEPTRLLPAVNVRLVAGQELDAVPPNTARNFLYVDDATDVCLKIAELGLQYGEL